LQKQNPEVLTILYVLVDGWYQAYGQELLKGKVGRKPICSDSEKISLMLAKDFISHPSETDLLSTLNVLLTIA
jgi:hypothetical protein